MSENTRIKDLTKGDPMQLIIMFALPIFFGNIFQQLYNLFDTMIAGYNLGDNALAAIGATSSIYSLIIGMANGMNNGYGIIVARSYGQKNMEKLRHSVGIMLVLNVAASVLFTVLSCAFIMPVLKLLNTPQEIIGQAYEYIIVILIGMTATILYNMGAGILRALGNSKTPLVFLIISLFANIGMDLIFVVGMKLGVGSTALATVLSQVLAVILCFIHIVKYYPELKLSKRHFIFEKRLVVEMFTTGFSMGLMSSIFAMGSVALQSAINGLGKATITAHLAARKIDEMLLLPLSTLSTANATFVGQNYGAKKMLRIKEGIKNTCLSGFIWSTLSVVLVFTMAPTLIKMITGTSDSYIVATAVKYLKINVPFFYAVGILFVFRTSLQGIGRKISPLVSSSIELIGKIAATWWLVPKIGYLGVCVAEPILWVLCTLFLAGTFFKMRNEFNGTHINHKLT